MIMHLNRLIENGLRGKKMFMKSKLSHATKKLIVSGILSIGVLLALPASAHAYTNLGENSDIQYVKVKRPLFTGQYTKVNGKKGHKIITPKGTILKVEATNGGSWAYFTRGAISYKMQQRIYQVPQTTKTYNKHYTTKYFRPYKLKLPVRTLAFQAGTGFTNSKAGNYKPIFYITLDGYLQYYSTPRLKHYGIQNSWEATHESRAVDNPIWTIKPTTAVKIYSFKTKGETSYIYYKKPVRGLTEKKVSAKYYCLSITKHQTVSKKWNYGDEDWKQGIWTRYTVGGHQFYYLVEISEGD